MEDHEKVKGSDKLQKVQFDSTKNQTHLLHQDAVSVSSSSQTSDSSLESTLTDKDEGDVLPESQNPIFSLDGPVSPYSNTPSDASGAQLVTGRPAGYDPNRIPSSIFNSRPTNPMEWSVASNESLFSIHMGNNSFSRDQAFLLYRSGELMKLDEVFSVPNALPPLSEGSASEKVSLSSRTDLREPETPTMNESAISHGNFSSGTVPQDSPLPESPSAGAPLCSGPSQASNMNTKPAPAESAKVEEHKARIPPMSPGHNEDARISTSLSTHSGGSGTSTGSFAFPV